jgi:hypothetical protein
MISVRRGFRVMRIDLGGAMDGQVRRLEGNS